MPTQTASVDHVSSRKLWFGTTAAAVAWALQNTICEIIASKACQNNVGNWGPISPGGVRWLMGGVTIIALAVAVAAGITSVRIWRPLSDEPDAVHAEGRRRVQFMSLVGMFASVAFVVGILWSGIPLIILETCVKAR
jgi:hypothetical protein